MKPVAALFVRRDSIYKGMAGVDAWDIDRDARAFPGGMPVVAHPPCRAWGRLRHFAKPRHDEKALALFAVDMVRKCGGVLEHPAASTLWDAAKLPAPGKRDQWGGFTLLINQNWWGHKAEKKTLLYVCGCEPKGIPVMPMTMREPTHVVAYSKRRRDGSRREYRPEITKSEREATPPCLAEWLCELARRCKPGESV